MDDRLRRLQRAAPGDRAARARLLQERQRRGELSAARLELLAYLGDAAARQLAPQAPLPPETLEAWVEGLAPWGPEALYRALVAAMRAALPAAEAERRPCQTCGSYGQVQVRFGETFDWEPCPACAHCPRCAGTRRFGPDALPCPECVDLRPRSLVELCETWVDLGSRIPLLEHVLARHPALLGRRDWDDPNRPALRLICSIALDALLVWEGPEPLDSIEAQAALRWQPALAAHIARHVLALHRLAQPSGCVGDAVVDALEGWAEG